MSGLIIAVLLVLAFLANAVMASVNLAIYLDQHASINAAAALFGVSVLIFLAAVIARGDR